MLLGIDVGGTKIALALGEESGAIRARDRWPTPGAEAGAENAAQRALAEVAQRARALAEEAGVPWREVAAVGVSLPGPLDREAGVLLDPPNLQGDWRGAPVQAWLSESLQKPVALENDANAAALAEWRFGAGRGCGDLVYLTMSTGVGGGLVLGGKLHRGVLESAGEIGHAPVEWQGEACACGQRGCLEAYVGGAAWTRRLAQRTPPESLAAQLASAPGAPPKVRPEHIVAAAKQGDDFALSEMARYNDYLARGIAVLAYALAPEMVILGTIPSAAGAALCLNPVRELVRARIWPFLAEKMRIELSGCGKDLPELAGIAAALQAADS